MARDEPDIREWVAYHLAIGAERVLIYDNDSRVPVASLFRSLIKLDRVAVFQIRGRFMQRIICEDMVRKGRERIFGSRWLACIDADEFIHPMERTVTDFRTVLADYPQAGLVLNWMYFGSSGLLRRPGKLVLDAYRRRQRALSGVCKSIVDPQRVSGLGHPPHSFRYRSGEGAVNEGHEPRSGMVVPPVGAVARINHYFFKSREDMALKVTRGSAIHGPGKTMGVLLNQDKESNAVHDASSARFLPEVRRYLAM